MEITPDTLVADIAAHHPRSIEVFERHGIDFCCGGRRALGEACREHGAAVETVAAEIAAAAAREVPEDRVATLEISEQMAAEQIAQLNEVRRTRDGKAVLSTLHTLREACRNGANVMPPLVEAVKAYATVGEISDVMREVFATWEEPAVF